MHGALTFPYQNPEQNPAPGRPRWDILFKVTPGAPVLPKAPELQAQTNVRLPANPGDIVSSPRFSAVGEPSGHYLWILSRTPQVDPARYQALLGRLAARGIDVQRLETSPQDAP